MTNKESIKIDMVSILPEEGINEVIKKLLVLSAIIILTIILTIYLLLVKPGIDLIILFFKALIFIGIPIGLLYGFFLIGMVMITLIELILFVEILKCD